MVKVYECPVCGVEFESEYNNQTYCSVKCRKKNQKNKLAEWKLNMTSNCAWCGKNFKGNRKYCCAKCRMEANRPITSTYRERLKKPKLSIDDVLAVCRKLGISYSDYSYNEQVYRMRGESYEEEILRRVQALHQGG